MTPDETIAQQTNRIISSIGVLQNENAQLRADLAQEKERSDVAEGCLASVRKFLDDEKARADALEKKLAEQITIATYWGKRCDQEKDDRATAESRLAALQGHADGLAKAAEALIKLDDWPPRLEYAGPWVDIRKQVHAYRAFAAEGKLTPTQIENKQQTRCS